MKFSSIISLGLPALALAAPTKTIEKKRGTLAKRASVTDAPATGYATEGDGTTGGAGGTTTTVSSFAQFSAAVSGDDAAIVIVDGALTSDDADTITVKVGSNKSIIGKDSGACTSPVPFPYAHHQATVGIASQDEGYPNQWADP